MKKIVSFFMVLVVVLSLSVSAMATDYNVNGYPDISTSPDHPYFVICKNGYYGTLLMLSDRPLYWDGQDSLSIKLKASEQQYTNWDVDFYVLTNDVWVYEGNHGGSSMSGVPYVYASNHDIKHPESNNVMFESNAIEVPSECDGSSCPATDVGMDNICDDCGKTLTMSLRSSLLDYAIQKHVPNGQSIHPDATYWLITENSEGGYSVILSRYPIEYIESRNQFITDAGMDDFYVSSVVEMSTGQNGGRGWSTVLEYTVPGDGVASNHTIEGFFPKPLHQVVGELVAEEMPMMEQTTVGTMRTLVLCGVGLVALLVVLKLFGKRSLIFRS